MLLYFWAFFFATVPRSLAVFLNRPSQENRKFIDRRTKGEKRNFNFSILYTKAKMQFAVSATFKCKIASLISRQRACMQSSRLFDRSYRFVRKLEYLVIKHLELFGSKRNLFHTYSLIPCWIGRWIFRWIVIWEKTRSSLPRRTPAFRCEVRSTHMCVQPALQRFHADISYARNRGHLRLPQACKYCGH